MYRRPKVKVGCTLYRQEASVQMEVPCPNWRHQPTRVVLVQTGGPSSVGRPFHKQEVRSSQARRSLYR